MEIVNRPANSIPPPLIKISGIKHAVNLRYTSAPFQNIIIELVI